MDTQPLPRRLLRFLAACVGLGVLVAGLCLPFVAVSGLSVERATQIWNALPADLPELALPQPSTILDTSGTQLATLYLYNRQPVDLDQVAPVMRQAIVAVEDHRFYSHGAVDARGIIRAVVNDASGGTSQGASTLTQQYVKNVLLLAAQTDAERAQATAPTLARKLREAKYAFALEHRYTKDQILERYLNVAYFAGGAYGVQAAAEHYFGKPASQLTLPEAALLAGMVKDPDSYDPAAHPVAAKDRRAVVLTAMRTTGVITDQQRAAADTTPIDLHVTDAANGCDSGPSAFYCQWVRQVLETDPSFGPTAAARHARLLAGGLTIRTALDPRVQAAAQHAVDAVPHTSRAAAAIVIVEPATGYVRAMAVNRDYGPNTAAGQTELLLPTLPSYQPGSTFKMFTLAAALEAGVPPTLRLPGGDHYTSPAFDNPPGGFHNAADGEGSNLTLDKATADSVNTAYVQLEEKVGVKAVAKMANRLGVTSVPLTGPHAVSDREGALTLGTREVSPLQMAGAYAAIAAHGRACTPIGIVSMTDNQGHAVAAPPSNCHQALAPAVADTVTDILTHVITDGTGHNAALRGRPVAGKTGTTDQYASAWFAGYTPQLAAAVWMGDPRGPQYPLVNILGYRQMFGGDMPARIWAAAVGPALAGAPVEQFAGPDGNVGALPTGPLVPDVTGRSVADATAALTAAGLRAQVVTVPAPNTTVGPGVVVSTAPSAGLAAEPGSTVTVRVTAGR